MPRCSECGDQFRSCRAVKQHYRHNHSEKYEEKKSKPNQDPRLIITNLYTYWKKQMPQHARQSNAEAHP